MNYYALIKAGVVQNVVRMEAAPVIQGYEVIDLAGRAAEPGWLWNGSVFSAPPEPVEVTNQRTIEQQADAALVSNLQLIADVNSFLNGAGAGSANLSLGQLSAFARQIAPAVKSLAQQNNGIIRLLRGNFSGTN